MRISKTEKQRRAALLTAQQNKCALGGEYMPTAHRMRYIEGPNAIICKACGMFADAYQAGLKRGVTPEVLAVFLARDAAPEPTVVEMKDHKKLSPEQLSARLMAAKGELGMTVAEHDQRTGGSGPVIDPDTGLEWIPDVEPEGERVFIDGEWKWV